VLGTLEGPEELQGARPAVWIPRTAAPTTDNPASYVVELDGVEGRDDLVASRTRSWMTLRYGRAANGQLPTTVLTFGTLRRQAQLLRQLLFDALLAFCIVPSCLVGVGVAAASRLAVQQRIAEIGLRRAIGATRQDIVDLFAREALRMAASATALAVLLAGLLFGFAYSLGWPVAPPSGMVALALSLPTLISFAFTVPQAAVVADLPPITAIGSP
jgi:predicted lysophospholipase L1 biosynthesis ABC-type transport system permease subunit